MSLTRIQCAVALIACLCAFQAKAQSDLVQPYQEHSKRVSAAGVVQPLSDASFGDSVGLYSGATEFAQTDIDVPGNGALPVRLGRRLRIEDTKGVGYLGGAGDWDLEIPYLEGTFSAGIGWEVDAPDRLRRCSTPTSPRLGTAQFELEEVWGGYWFHLPGTSDSELFVRGPTSPSGPTDGANYPWITKGLAHVRCLPATKNGYPGEAFVVVTPDGIKYYLDWVVVRRMPILSKPYMDTGYPESNGKHARERVMFLASKVEDRFGNTVSYTYSGDRLTVISSSDGRTISLAYAGSTLTSATVGDRTWSYGYSGSGKLSQVTQPDQSKWLFSDSGALRTAYNGLPQGDDWEATCPEPDPGSGYYQYSITHPGGARATYTFALARHYRTSVPWFCASEAPGYDRLIVPNYFDTFALVSKSISGPGLATMNWGYEYGEVSPFGFCRPGQPCIDNECFQALCPPPDSKWVTTTLPGGTKKRLRYGVRYGANEGQLLGEETIATSGAILHSTSLTYATGGESGAAFGTRIGEMLRSVDPLANAIRPQRATAIAQDGVSFNSYVNTYDTFARPLSVTKSSTLGYTKTETTEFHDDLIRWVLGQVKKAMTGTIVTSETYYDPTTALPLWTKVFGRLQQTLSYNLTLGAEAGTLATVTDGNNNVTTLSSWYRGIPRLIRHPATRESPGGATESASVNDSGWITSVVDENGYATDYGYDAMGRLASIVYPTDDSTVWNTTTIRFSNATTDRTPYQAVYGLPAGHWRQTVSTGTARTVTMFDALWRPVVKETYDASDTAGTLSQTVTRYDADGRTSFVSYPQRTLVAGVINTWADPFQTPNALGTRTEYDVLDRVTAIRQDSELGVLSTTTEFLPGLQTRVTLPKHQGTGISTTTAYMAWGEPTTDYPIYIQHPESAKTWIERDLALGKPKWLRRYGNPGQGDLVRYYAYDAHQRLCKRMELETGTTLLGYDAASNPTWQASGLPWSDPNRCDDVDPSARKVVREYDARNRITALRFPDRKGDQDWSYTPDGLPASITNWQWGGAGVVPIVTAYHYNKRRLLNGQGETLTQPQWYTWAIGYGYDGNASLAVNTYPSGLSVAYAPNALGQATQAGGFASGVQYYPNGAISQFTYGNGIAHSMLQNTRQLPSWVMDGNGAQHASYGYDAHANVAQMTDHATGRQTRSLGYDGLDRLIRAESPMFDGGGSMGDPVAEYAYDALDNLTRVKVRGRDHTYVYDPANRLTNVTNTVGGASVIGLGYDVQGNLANKNGATYRFDYGNRLQRVDTAPGQVAETYRYDALGRRVLAWSPTLGNILSFYSRAGQLMYQQDWRAGKLKDHVYLAGSLVAIREQSLSTYAYSTKYQHTDALGTPIATSNDAAQIVERSEYEPYGQLANRPLTDGPGFTGHVQDAATGMTYMQQRYYDPAIGRFLSVDPVAANPNTGAMFNRYYYANNNPYRFIDPDGRRSKEEAEYKREQAVDRRSITARCMGCAARMATSARSAGATTQGTVHRASTQSQGQGLGSYGPLHTPICNTAMSGCSAQSVYDNGLKVLPGPGGDGQPMQNGAISQLFVGPTQHWFDDKNLTVRNVALDGHELSGVVTRQVVMDGGGWVYIQTSKVGPATPANVAARVFDASLWRDVDLRIQRLVYRQAGE